MARRTKPDRQKAIPRSSLNPKMPMPSWLNFRVLLFGTATSAAPPNGATAALIGNVCRGPMTALAGLRTSNHQHFGFSVRRSPACGRGSSSPFIT